MGDQDELSTVEDALVSHFDVLPARASVSFVGVEPITVLRFDLLSDEEVYATLGMSTHPMSGADDGVVAQDGPRAELLLRVRGDRTATTEVWRRLAVLAATPAVEGFVYADGVSVELGESLIANSSCVGAVVTAGPLPPVATTAGPVQLLQLLPATSTELAWCRVRGSQALRSRWSEHGTDLLDLLRRPVALD